MKAKVLAWSALALAVLISGCSTSNRNTGKYYDKDGPPSGWGAIGMSRTDAVPKVEKPIAATNRPYKVMGKTYTPMTGDKPLTQIGYGSWYGKQFHGKKTSTGEIYNMYEMSAAHTTMELPSYARVTNLENGKSVIVRVNDRGPFLHSRVIDLSYAAATKLGYANKGTAKVKVERLTRAQIASGEWKKGGNGLVGTVLAAAASAAKSSSAENETASSARSSAGEDFIEALATQGNVTEVPSPVTADKVEIEPAPEVSSDRQLIPEGVYTVAGGSDSTTTLGTFENEIREEVIHSIREQASSELASGAARGHYAVQLGVFRSHDNALALKKRFLDTLGDKMTAEVRIEKINGLYKVVVGKAMSEEQAKSAVSIIRDALNIKAFTLKE